MVDFVEKESKVHTSSMPSNDLDHYLIRYSIM